MTQKDFDLTVEKLYYLRSGIVEKKRPEYTEDSPDVLNNFKTVATELGLDPVQVWYIYFRKHIASIGQYCKRGVESEPIVERIADAMNYLELLNGLIQEANETKI